MDEREEIVADIEATREQLSETVSALGDKLDVKGRVKDSAHQATENVKESAQQATETVRSSPVLPAAVAAAFVAVAGTLVWRWTR